MAFLRTSFSALKANKRENFESTYKFRKKVDFKVGTDVYVLPLGLEHGFFETPVHRVLPHEVDGQTIGFGGYGFPTNIRCKGYDAEGNKIESLCCKLARLEKERFPEKDDSGKRIIGFPSYRMHIPVLILGNSLADKSKMSYPISKVSILNELNSEKGLNFSYLEMASSTFQQDIFNKLGEELKNNGVLDYELSESSEEYFQAVGQHLMNTVIKVRGVSKQGFGVALQEYSFFPFSSEAIASGSPEGEREAIINYRKNDTIMAKVNEYLQLFRGEVDRLFRDWTDKELQEYYNSAVGRDLKANVVTQAAAPVQETVEVITPAPQVAQPVAPAAPAPQEAPQPKAEPVSEEDLDSFLSNPFQESATAIQQEPTADSSLDDFAFDLDNDDDFLS